MNTSTPRPFFVAILTSILLAIQYVVADAAAWQAGKHDLGGSSHLFDLVVIQTFGPFVGRIFGDQIDAGTLLGGQVTGDARTSFLVGLVAAVVVFGLLVWLISRRGSLATLFGAWFAVVAATAAGCVVSAAVWAGTVDIAGLKRSGLYASALDHGLHWGFVFGWLPALVAALLAGVLRKRETADDAPAEHVRMM
jgi:hypothetical protein